MSILKRLSLSFFIIFNSISISFAQGFAQITAGDSPVGYWKTIDDVSGKPKSIVHIWENKSHHFVGQIIKMLPNSNENQHKRCMHCQGLLHNQPLVGMMILSGLQTQSKQWDKGYILDPANGKTYRCSIKLLENGHKLQIHGYIGIPLFGRSQTWERVDLIG